MSVVITVINEAETIGPLLNALAGQTLAPAEIIVVDGGSADETSAKIKAQIPNHKNLKFFEKTGNRAVGRNWGVKMAGSPLIAFTDAGCTPQKDWLEKLVKPFADPTVWVVSGYYKGIARNAFEKSLIPFVLVMPDRIGPEFLPATRSMAIRKSVFVRSGGFNENLWHNEDYEFALRLKKSGAKIAFAKGAIVAWQPRKDLKSAAWMFLRFAIGDGQAGILRPKVKMLFVRYYIFAFLIFVTPLFWLLGLPYLLWAIWKNYKYVRAWQGLFWLPLLQLTADIMVMFGTIVGLLSRVR